MSDDLVKRLRDSFFYDQQHYAPDPLVKEAADRIEALEAENARLREMLRGMCDAYELLCQQAGMNYYESKFSKYAQARAALTQGDAK